MPLFFRYLFAGIWFAGAVFSHDFHHPFVNAQFIIHLPDYFFVGLALGFIIPFLLFNSLHLIN